MRYNKTIPEMSYRLEYLAENFIRCANGETQYVYTGPNVNPTAPFPGHSRPQDPYHLSSTHVVLEQITKDLISVATETGEMEKITPVLQRAAAQCKPYIGKLEKAPETLMQYAPA